MVGSTPTRLRHKIVNKNAILCGVDLPCYMLLRFTGQLEAQCPRFTHAKKYRSPRKAAFEETKPDARDYYQIPDSILFAHSQYQSRLDRVAAVSKELDVILTAIL